MPGKKTTTAETTLALFQTIDLLSTAPAYIQIENRIRYAIASERLKPGDQLPTVQELSNKLGLNFNTIVKAYRDLEVMELLYPRRGKGVFVKEGAPERCRRQIAAEVAARLWECVGEAKAAGFSQKAVLDAVKECLASDAKPYEPMAEGVRKAMGKAMG